MKKVAIESGCYTCKPLTDAAFTRHSIVMQVMDGKLVNEKRRTEKVPRNYLENFPQQNPINIDG